MRMLMNKAFLPKSVERMRPRVKDLIRELVEPLQGRDDVDFLMEFAFHLPVIVIAEFLGIPAEARMDVSTVAGTVSQYAVGTAGQLTPLMPATITAGIGPGWIAFDPFGKYAYVVNLGNGTLPGTVSA
jgi:cytochrome P450